MAEIPQTPEIPFDLMAGKIVQTALQSLAHVFMAIKSVEANVAFPARPGSTSACCFAVLQTASTPPHSGLAMPQNRVGLLECSPPQ